MATPLTDRINYLISVANTATGESDTTLSDAVETLVDGYGQGSSTVSVTEVQNAYGVELVITFDTDPTPDPDPTPGPDPTPTPSGDWETVFNDSVTASVSQTSGKYVFRIEELQDVWFTNGDIWRVTYDGIQYVCTVTAVNGTPAIGNGSLLDTDNGVNEPFVMYNVGSGAMIGVVRTLGTHTLKLEQSV